MKRFTLVSIAFLFTLPGFAQTDIHALMDQLNVGLAERGREHDDYNAMGQAKKSLDSQQHDVQLDQQQWDKAFATHQKWLADWQVKQDANQADIARHTKLVADNTAKVADVSARSSVHKQWADRHNANRCYYPPNNPNACAGYEAERQQIAQEAASLTSEINAVNAEAARLNALAADLNAVHTPLAEEGGRINADKAMVDQQGQNLNNAIAAYKAQAEKYNAWAKKHNDEWNANEAKIARILADLKAAGVQTDNCQNALKNTGDGALENIHAVCGHMFDGNKNDRPLTNQGTGGASQN
jgi:chromosome segregation ATPase